MSALRLDGVDVRLGATTVLHEVSLDLDARTIAVIGENGSGKSTFARLVGGLIAPTAGTVGVLGLDPVRHAAELRRRVAVVFSNPDAQIVLPTVREDVAFSLRAQKLSRAVTAERVERALEHFGLLEFAEQSSHDLSGGQKQLLALCGAFVRSPGLVIADEPTASLDARNARRIADHLFAPEHGHRLVLVTHDLALAERCEVAVLFTDGSVTNIGEPAEIVTEYQAALQC